MREEVTVFYPDDSGQIFKPSFFDCIVTTDGRSGETAVIISAELESNKLSLVALKITKERWFEFAKNVQEAFDYLDNETAVKS